MKTLMLLRHAKSSWDDATLADHDRPLNKRGKRDAPRIGKRLLDEEMTPELIITSTANRARTTAELVVDYSEFNGVWIEEREMYGATASDYLRLIAVHVGQGDFDRVMLVGHNPTMEIAVEEFAGEYARMPTAALAFIEFAIDDWREVIGALPGRLVGVWRPKEMG